LSARGIAPEPQDTAPRKSQNPFIRVATTMAQRQIIAKIRKVDEVVVTMGLPRFRDGECSPRLVCFESHLLTTIEQL
jgi:hypothetical protein